MVTWRVTILPYPSPPFVSPPPPLPPPSEIPNLWGNPLALVVWCEDLHNSISNSFPSPWHLICTALPPPCHLTHTTLGGHPLTCMITKTLHQMQKVRQKKKSKEDRSGLTIQCIPALPLLLMQKLDSSLPIYMSLTELCMFEWYKPDIIGILWWYWLHVHKMLTYWRTRTENKTLAVLGRNLNLCCDFQSVHLRFFGNLFEVSKKWNFWSVLILIRMQNIARNRLKFSI